VSVGDFSICDGSRADIEPLTALYLRSRTAAMPWLVSPHDEPATRWWMEHVVLAAQRVWVAQSSEGVLGFAAVDGHWLEQLYVDPEAQARGVGRALLDAAKGCNPEGLMLHVFARNISARRFYEAARFLLTDQSDGSRNEEREPDCTYTWPGSTPQPRRSAWKPDPLTERQAVHLTRSPPNWEPRPVTGSSGGRG